MRMINPDYKMSNGEIGFIMKEAMSGFMRMMIDTKHMIHLIMVGLTQCSDWMIVVDIIRLIMKI